MITSVFILLSVLPSAVDRSDMPLSTVLILPPNAVLTALSAYGVAAAESFAA